MPAAHASHATDRLAIVVEDLHEIFRIYDERPPGLKERLFQLKRAHYREFSALRGVNLEVRHGESVALIGHNGSGKSTLLKCLARILPADRGSVTVNGRIATLLELGAGFHQDLSGRENIYLNGAILGLTRAEITASFDAIVDFAGVADFIDTPVRNYSSGMYVRLGFAVAVHVDPDILLVDEVLSVGDAAFQERSLARMRAFSQRGKTVILVSHDLAAVTALCRRTVVLDHGRIVFDGPTEQAVEVYDEIIHGGRLPAAVTEQTPDLRTGDRRAIIAAADLDVGLSPAAPGDAARVTVTVEACEDLVSAGGLTAGINVRRRDLAVGLYETRTSWRTLYLAPPPVGASLRVTFDLRLTLLAGEYVIDLLVANASSNSIHDRWLEAVAFMVAAPEHEFGIVPLDARITIDNPDGIWPPDSHPPPLSEGGPRAHGARDDPQAAPRPSSQQDPRPPTAVPRPSSPR